MTDLTGLARRFELFAQECRGSSPLYERLALGVARDPLALELASHARPGQPPANMLLGAVHALLLGGAEHRLAEFYPSLRDEPAAGDPCPAFHDFCAAHARAIAAILASRAVQTNEVRRSALLLPAFAEVARLAGAPLALVEVGASAGLNLRWDSYGYRYGAASCGDAASQVQLACEPRGEPPPIPGAPPAVAWRLGIDISPVDVRDDSAVAWLRALIWPEHRGRVALLERAVAAARLDPPHILAGDALDLLPGALDAAPADAALCVYDTFTVNQLTPAAREALLGMLAARGRRRPLWRVSIGWNQGEGPTVRITDFGAAAAPRTVARCDPHGAWIEWL